MTPIEPTTDLHHRGDLGYIGGMRLVTMGAALVAMMAWLGCGEDAATTSTTTGSGGSATGTGAGLSLIHI